MNIAIAGASGRMGRILVEAILHDSAMTLVGALTRSNSSQFGQDAGAFLGTTTGIVLTDNLDQVLSQADYLIDFTRPESTMTHIEAAKHYNVKLVIGTTGFDTTQKAQLHTIAESISIVFAANMSRGVNVTLKLLEIAARYFATDYDIEIIEAHHRHKVDAPSGTALMMGETIASVLGHNIDEHAVYSRYGITEKRNPSTIGFCAIRGGDIVGDHTVLFAGIGERIEIAHKSTNRTSYAQGALHAVRFLKDRATGLYDMQDVLGLR